MPVGEKGGGRNNNNNKMVAIASLTSRNVWRRPWSAEVRRGRVFPARGR